jgi:hypothetical protein
MRRGSLTEARPQALGRELSAPSRMSELTNRQEQKLAFITPSWPSPRYRQLSGGLSRSGPGNGHPVGTARALACRMRGHV